MTAHHVEPVPGDSYDTAVELIEVHNPGAPDEVVRIGPTVTQLMGFGPTLEVATWVARGMGPASRVFTVGAVDDAARVHDEVLTRGTDDVDAELDALEDRAQEIEDAIARFDEAARASSSDAGIRTGVREANVAQALAAEFDAAWSGGPVGEPTFERVMQAHVAVDAARRAFDDASRTRRSALSAALEEAIALENEALSEAGVATFTQFLAINVARYVHVASSGADPARRDIELRARAAQLLGRLPGAQPAAELRAFAASRVDAVMHRPDPTSRNRLVEELVAIDRRGRALVDALECCVDDPRTYGPSTWAAIAVGSGTNPLVVDGDVFDAVAPDVHDALQATLRDAALRRRVVVVSDDVLLDAWLATVPNSLLWTSGHLHLVLAEGRPAWDEDDGRRSASLRVASGRDELLATCVEHPSSITRLTCSVCARPFCSVCLVPVAGGNSVICVSCALERSGARVRPRRPKRRL